MSITQIHNYIVRQMKQNRMSSHNVINTWADYLSMAKGLHMDTDWRTRLSCAGPQEAAQRIGPKLPEIWDEYDDSCG